MTSSASDLRLLLFRHLDAFNRGVRTGDFSTMFELYHRDATFVLSDPVRIIHRGLEAIRSAYRGDPPHGTMQVRDPRVSGQSVTADYIWDAEPDRVAGQLVLEVSDGRIIHKLVTFAPD